MSAQKLNEGQVRHWNERGRNRSIDRLLTHDKVDFTAASLSSERLVRIGYSKSIEGISLKFHCLLSSEFKRKCVSFAKILSLLSLAGVFMSPKHEIFTEGSSHSFEPYK